jgi:TetR/AcrR family transcriptional regulator, cholesterol catabolism regulator
MTNSSLAKASTARDPTRRARILSIAKRHLTEGGFRGVNLASVASEAHCAKGAIYLEFPDKHALVRAVFEELLDATRKRYEAEVVALASPLGRLVGALAFAYREAAREPLYARLMRDDTDLQALALRTGNATEAKARAEVERLASWVDEGLARGEIDPSIDRDIVPLLIGILRNAPLHVPAVTTLGASGDRVLDGLVELFRRGLAAAPHAPSKRLRRSA